MKIKTLICNCKGLSPEFRDLDTASLGFEIESDLNVDYALMHPQLCGKGGSKLLADIVRSAEDDGDTLVLVGACAAQNQQELLAELLREAGFDQEKLLSVDIRNTTNQGVLDRLRKKIEERIQARKRHR